MFTLGPPPRRDSEALRREGWTPAFQGASPGALVKVAAGGLAAVLLLFAWNTLTPTALGVWSMPLTQGVPLLLATLLMHEAMHYATYPRAGKTTSRGVGFWPQRFIAYSYFQGPMSRGRRVACGLAPFALLSIAPLLAAMALRLDTPAAAFVSFWNAVGSSADLVLAARVVARVPSGAEVLMDGSGLWTRPP